MSEYFNLTSQGRVFDSSGWWMFLDCDPGIINFYQWLCRRNGLDILKGSKSGPHISIVRGERPVNIDQWKSILNRKFKFQYSNEIRYNDNHAWLDVSPEPFIKIREDLGLRPFRSFHLTIGRFKHVVMSDNG